LREQPDNGGGDGGGWERWKEQKSSRMCWISRRVKASTEIRRQTKCGPVWGGHARRFENEGQEAMDDAVMTRTDGKVVTV
jgi:hypothetical protein